MIQSLVFVLLGRAPRYYTSKVPPTESASQRGPPLPHPLNTLPQPMQWENIIFISGCKDYASHKF